MAGSKMMTYKQQVSSSLKWLIFEMRYIILDCFGWIWLILNLLMFSFQ